MIFFKSHWKTGASTIEYMTLVVFIISALIVFDKYIARAFWGQWKKAGDAFGHGKYYDPRPFGVAGDGGGTLECMFIYTNPDDGTENGRWVTQPCYDACLDRGTSPATCAQMGVCGNDSDCSKE